VGVLGTVGGPEPEKALWVFTANAWGPSQDTVTGFIRPTAPSARAGPSIAHYTLFYDRAGGLVIFNSWRIAGIGVRPRTQSKGAIVGQVLSGLMARQTAPRPLGGNDSKSAEQARWRGHGARFCLVRGAS